jgi:hypothetical protein
MVLQIVRYAPPQFGVVGIARDTLSVPEPTMLALLGFALAGYLVFNRRRVPSQQATAF